MPILRSPLIIAERAMMYAWSFVIRMPATYNSSMTTGPAGLAGIRKTCPLCLQLDISCRMKRTETAVVELPEQEHFSVVTVLPPEHHRTAVSMIMTRCAPHLGGLQECNAGFHITRRRLQQILQLQLQNPL